MLNDKHTPGPWEETSLDGWDAVKPVGINLAVCQLVENNPANARLIAAAPDLKDGCNALLGLLQLLSERDDIPAEVIEIMERSHRVVEAKAAIAKAA